MGRKEKGGSEGEATKKRSMEMRRRGEEIEVGREKKTRERKRGGRETRTVPHDTHSRGGGGQSVD